MSKRNPTSDLNHENWDQEDEKEDAGHFKTASQEVLKSREIRVAKRRALASEDKGTGGLFKSFTGFTGFGAGVAVTSATSNSMAFNFSTTAATMAPTSATTTESTSSSSDGKTAAADPNATHLAKLKSLNQSVLRWIQSHVTTSPYCVLTPVFRDYERHLADIERQHPYVESATASATTPAVGTIKTTTTTTIATDNSATPSMAPAVTSATSSTMPAQFSFSAATSSAAMASKPVPEPASTSSFSSTSSSVPATTSAPSMPPTFSFNFSAGAAKPPSTTPNQPPAAEGGAATTATFFFGSTSKSTTASSTSTTTVTTSTTSGAAAAAPSALSGFKFGAAPTLPQPGLSLFGPGGFAAASAAASSASQEDHEEEEYEPPKPETREIREDGAVFSQKCKLFYMAAGEAKQWREKGIGCVHVKPTEGGGKAQLIVRADNTLGTIMLNTLVTKDITLSVAKNNLNLACPPNPPLPKSAADDRRIVPFLVRLKTEADAKELLAKINGLREAA